MKFIPPWLRNFHYHTDPYSAPQAESLLEEMIKPLFVFSVFEPRFSDPDLNILNYPGSTIIHGWGKTMGLRWMIWWAKQKRDIQGAEDRPLVVPYTHFQQLLNQAPPVTCQHHAAPLMIAFALACLMLLSETGMEHIFMSQPARFRQNWWAFLNQYLPGGWDRTLDRDTLPEILWSDMQFFHEDRLLLDGELDQSLGVLTSWLNKIGISQVYIGIDNIAGYQQLKDPGQAAQLICPLVETDQLFHLPGLYWKIFLSDAVKEKLFPAPENRLLRYRVFPIAWNPGCLLEMVNKTLKECANPPLNNLSDLSDRLLQLREPPIAEELANLAMLYPGGPPQTMLMFINELLQRADRDGSTLITTDVASSFMLEIEQLVEHAVLKRSSEIQDLEDRVKALIIDLQQSEAQYDAADNETQRENLKKEIAEIKVRIDECLKEIENKEGTMENNEREQYVKLRKESLQKRYERLTSVLEKLETQYDYGYNERERQRLKLEVGITKENIEEALTEVENLVHQAEEGQRQELNKIKFSLEEMGERVQKLEKETEAIRVLVDSYEVTYRDWAGKIINTIDQAYIQEVKDVLAAVDRLPQPELLPLLNAVEQVRVEPRQASSRRGLLVEEGKQVITQSDVSCSTRIKLSIPIIPLLLNWDTELGFDGKVDLRALWDRVVQLARKETLDK